MAKRKKHWMQEAFSKHPGKFSRKAHKAGKSTMEYAKEEAHAPGALGKEARLAEIGKRFGGHKKHHRGSRRSSRRR